MNTFLSTARDVLEEANGPLHYKQITEKALEKGLKSEGNTPWATMNAQIAVDIKRYGEGSIFFRSKPGFYGLKRNVVVSVKPLKLQLKVNKVTAVGYFKTKPISIPINSKQKGDIAEARVAELITLYGDEGLSCYRPVSDDEGIDIIVKKRGATEVAYVQVKSTFGNGSRGFVSTVKEKNIVDSSKMLLVFVYFDLREGDLHEHAFCIPGSEFLKLTENKTKKSKQKVFTVGLSRPDKSKYAKYLIEKRELANKILESLRG